MKKWTVFIAGALAISSIAFACSKSKPTAQAEESSLQNPSTLLLGEFSADSAYKFIAEQVAFGPRVPGTTPHSECRRYLINRLRGFNPDSIFVQDGEVTAFNGDRLPITNIIARYNTSTPRRILLVAHWDTRPWADKEDNIDERHQPFDGANAAVPAWAYCLRLHAIYRSKPPT